MKKQSSKSISEIKTQELFDQLESITVEIEQGKLDLESGIARYKEGTLIASELKKRLAKLENEIIEIKPQIE